MERKSLESAAVHVTYLRGLLAIPLGVMFVVVGLGDLGWHLLGSASAFVGAVRRSALGAAYLAISRYYDDHYGRITLSRQQQVRYAVASAVLFPTALIARPVMDFSLDPPVSAFASLFAVAMLAWFTICIGLRARHAIIWGLLLLAGIVPVWGQLADSVSVAWLRLPIGAATIAAGLLDHRALVQTFGSAKGPHLERRDARA